MKNAAIAAGDISLATNLHSCRTYLLRVPHRLARTAVRHPYPLGRQPSTVDRIFCRGRRLAAPIKGSRRSSPWPSSRKQEPEEKIGGCRRGRAPLSAPPRPLLSPSPSASSPPRRSLAVELPLLPNRGRVALCPLYLPPRAPSHFSLLLLPSFLPLICSPPRRTLNTRGRRRHPLTSVIALVLPAPPCCGWPTSRPEPAATSTAAGALLFPLPPSLSLSSLPRLLV